MNCKNDNATVAELIEFLKTMPQNLEVYVDADAEGYPVTVNAGFLFNPPEFFETDFYKSNPISPSLLPDSTCVYLYYDPDKIKK